MPKFKIFVRSLRNNSHGVFSRKAACQVDVLHDWLSLHPDTVVEKIEEVKVESEEKIEPTKPCKCKKEITSRQWRNHHKARITQMRNNTLSLMEDEDAILTDSERLQLSRIACQFDRILALWAGRSMDLNIINHKK